MLPYPDLHCQMEASGPAPFPRSQLWTQILTLTHLLLFGGIKITCLQSSNWKIVLVKNVALTGPGRVAPLLRALPEHTKVAGLIPSWGSHNNQPTIAQTNETTNQCFSPHPQINFLKCRIHNVRNCLNDGKGVFKILRQPESQMPTTCRLEFLSLMNSFLENSQNMLVSSPNKGKN